MSAPIPTPRVDLGPITALDSEPLFRWFNDPQAAKLDYAWRPVDGMSHQKWFTSVGTDPTQVWFALRRHGQSAMIGFVVLRNISPVNRSAELGVRIGQEADRGQGLGTEAARLAVQFCWSVLNLNRIQVSVIGDNERARRLYGTLGFRREGNLRQALFIDGAWKNLVVMGLLRPKVTRPKT